MQSGVCLCLISLLIRFSGRWIVVPIVQCPFRVIQRGKFKKWVSYIREGEGVEFVI
jgi:hypothetical protein